MLKKDKVLNFSRLVFHYIYKYIYIYIYFMIFCRLHIFCIIINLSVKLVPLENRHLNLKNGHKFYLIYIWNKKSMIVWSWNNYAISRRLLEQKTYFTTQNQTSLSKSLKSIMLDWVESLLIFHSSKNIKFIIQNFTRKKWLLSGFNPAL